MSRTAVLELPPVSEKATDRLELRLEPAFRKAIEKAAKKKGLNRTAYVKMSVVNQLNQDGVPYPPEDDEDEEEDDKSPVRSKRK
jgi:hypothetical protein